MEEYVTALGDRAAEQEQLDRQHILLVNSAPAILDLARPAGRGALQRYRLRQNWDGAAG